MNPQPRNCFCQSCRRAPPLTNKVRVFVFRLFLRCHTRVLTRSVLVYNSTLSTPRDMLGSLLRGKWLRGCRGVFYDNMQGDLPSVSVRIASTGSVHLQRGGANLCCFPMKSAAHECPWTDASDRSALLAPRVQYLRHRGFSEASDLDVEVSKSRRA